MMEAADTSEASVDFYQTTRRYNPKDSHLHTRRGEVSSPAGLQPGTHVPYTAETGAFLCFQTPSVCAHSFMLRLKFRAVFSALFFAPLVLMFVIYMHIFSIVRRHQVNRLRLSQLSHGSRHHGSAGSTNQQMTRSVKAIHTTLFILGSYIVGWMPAVLSYLLFCEDCLFRFNTFNKFIMFFIYTIVNLLVIFKTLLNPIIYAARMHEIKVSTSLTSCVLLQVERCPSGITGKSNVVLEIYIFVERRNKTAHKN
jgi:hypothetical protein